jgi:putative isomerase
MRKIFYTVLILGIAANLIAQKDIKSFADQIKCSHFPETPDDKAEYYTSRGAWFGYTIPEVFDTENLGKFGGPYCIKTDKWMAQSLLQFNFGVAGKGSIPLASADEIEISQFAGQLQQIFTFPDYRIELNLNIVSPRTALYQATAINISDKNQSISMLLSGEMFDGLGEAEKFTDGWLYKVDKKDDIFWLVRFRLDGEMELNYSTQNYEFSFKQLQTVAPGDSIRIVAVVSQYFKGDQQQDVAISSDALNVPETHVKRNELFWNSVVELMKTEDLEYRKLCMKSLQTIHLDMRSYLPGFRNFNFVPDTGIESHYIDTDKSWLLASALIGFDPTLAMHQLASILAAKNADGSLNKFISIDKSQPLSSPLNEKPMAAWTAYNIWAVSPEKEFLTQIYPLLEEYHKYWYTSRDANKNLWCENADGIESVELNAMLFTEKYCLKKMAELMGDTVKAKKYQVEIDRIKTDFNKYFFNKEKKLYFDVDIKTNSPVATEDVIGYCLWSGLATWESAEAYAISIDQLIFDGYYDSLFASGNYDIEYYYYLIAGLKQYTLVEISNDLKTKLLSEQLKATKTQPIKSLDMETNKLVNNSSVAAAVLLLLINY